MRKPITVFIVEDEAIIAESIKTMIEKMGYHCVGTATSAQKALDHIRALQPNLLLLDIRLKGEKSGIWLAENIKMTMDIPFIFMTSFSDQKTVAQAVTTHPHGYLVKPIQYEQVFTTIAAALAKYAEEKNNTTQTPHTPLSEASIHPNEKDILFIKDGHEYIKINLAHINFIRADGNYLHIHHHKKNIIRESLKNIEPKLAQGTFFQVHRSYLINLKNIERITGNTLHIANHQIPISRQKKEELLNAIKTFQ